MRRLAWLMMAFMAVVSACGDGTGGGMSGPDAGEADSGETGQSDLFAPAPCEGARDWPGCMAENATDEHRKTCKEKGYDYREDVLEACLITETTNEEIDRLERGAEVKNEDNESPGLSHLHACPPEQTLHFCDTAVGEERHGCMWAVTTEPETFYPSISCTCSAETRFEDGETWADQRERYCDEN